SNLEILSCLLQEDYYKYFMDYPKGFLLSLAIVYSNLNIVKLLSSFNENLIIKISSFYKDREFKFTNLIYLCSLKSNKLENVKFIFGEYNCFDISNYLKYCILHDKEEIFKIILDSYPLKPTITFCLPREEINIKNKKISRFLQRYKSFINVKLING